MCSAGCTALSTSLLVLPCILRSTGQDGAALVQRLRKLPGAQREWLCPRGNRGMWNTRLCFIQLICIKMAAKAFVCHMLQQDLRGASSRMELLHRNVAFPHLCCLWLALFSTVLYVSFLVMPFPCSYKLPSSPPGAFSSPSLSMGALHSPIFPCRQMGAASHTTSGLWKNLQGDGSHVLTVCPVLLCLVTKNLHRSAGNY